MLGDAILQALPTMQAEAESRMIEPCTVTRVTGTTLTGDRDVEVISNVWAGLCELQTSAVVAQSPEAAGATVDQQRLVLKVPVSAGPFHVGDLATVAGRKLRITQLHRKTFQTAQRLGVEEVV